MFFEVCRYENSEFKRRSLLDAHFDAPCINIMATNTQMMQTMMGRHLRRVRVGRHTVLKFRDDIGSDASDRRHFRSGCVCTLLHFGLRVTR